MEEQEQAPRKKKKEKKAWLWQKLRKAKGNSTEKKTNLNISGKVVDEHVIPNDDPNRSSNSKSKNTHYRAQNTHFSLPFLFQVVQSKRHKELLLSSVQVKLIPKEKPRNGIWERFLSEVKLEGKRREMVRDIRVFKILIRKSGSIKGAFTTNGQSFTFKGADAILDLPEAFAMKFLCAWYPLSVTFNWLVMD